MCRCSLAAITLALLASPQQAIAQRPAARQEQGSLDDGATERGHIALPPNVRVIRDAAYGLDPLQRYDVYIPARASHAPVILMVHGGGWRTGDKDAKSVVENKVRHWAAAGIIVISVNYRLLPGAGPLEQAGDIGRALSHAQFHLPEWGGDPTKIVLMGHSSGAHLVALLATSPGYASREGAAAWLGTVILDSAVLDVVDVMEHPHLPLYTAAFGTNQKLWRQASPMQQLVSGTTPMLVVCSSQRRLSCPAAEKFVAKASKLAVRASVLEEPMSHREINAQLGASGEYTEKVDVFLRTVDGSFAKALSRTAQTK